MATTKTSPKTINILICGNYGAGNFGDELILKGLLKVVRQRPRAQIIVTSGNPAETRRLHGETIVTCPFVPSSAGSWIKSIFTGKAFQALNAIRKTDLIIFGGGGLFNEKESRSIQIWSRQASMWKRLKKRAIMVGQSFGEITQPHHQKIIRDVCASMKKICVRDTTSKKNLEQLGVKHSITVLRDSALWLTAEDFGEDVQRHQGANNLSHETFNPYALISLRTWPGVDHGELTQKIKELTTYIHDRYHLSLKFVAMQKGDTCSVENVPHIEPENLDDLWHIFVNSSLVVAMRLHACILATLSHKPLLSLSYDAKVRNLLTDLGQGDSITDLRAPIQTWIQQLQKPKNQLRISETTLRADQHTLLKILTKLIKSI